MLYLFFKYKIAVVLNFAFLKNEKSKCFVFKMFISIDLVPVHKSRGDWIPFPINLLLWSRVGKSIVYNCLFIDAPLLLGFAPLKYLLSKTSEIVFIKNLNVPVIIIYYIFTSSCHFENF